MNKPQPSHEAIAERAYCLWKRAGRPAGRAEEFWLRAEADLKATAAGSGVPPVIAPPMIVQQSTPGALAVHQVPPPIKDAVKTPGRRTPRPRTPKRA
jgi:hypothetical protein